MVRIMVITPRLSHVSSNVIFEWSIQMQYENFAKLLKWAIKFLSQFILSANQTGTFPIWSFLFELDFRFPD